MASERATHSAVLLLSFPHAWMCDVQPNRGVCSAPAPAGRRLPTAPAAVACRNPRNPVRWVGGPLQRQKRGCSAGECGGPSCAKSAMSGSPTHMCHVGPQRHGGRRPSPGECHAPAAAPCAWCTSRDVPEMPFARTRRQNPRSRPPPNAQTPGACLGGAAREPDLSAAITSAITAAAGIALRCAMGQATGGDWGNPHKAYCALLKRGRGDS